MAVLVECPRCRQRLSLKSKRCMTKKGKGCRTDLDKEKRNNNVFYWIAYRLPGEKNPTWERFKTKEDAEAYETDRRDRINKETLKTKEDLKPKPAEPKLQDTMTFRQVSDWYLNQDFVKAKRSYNTIRVRLMAFNKYFRDKVISKIQASDLENYKAKREKEAKHSTIDQEIVYAKAAIRKLHEDRKIDYDVYLTFKGIKKLLVKNSNVRNVVLTVEEFWGIYETINERSKDVWKILGYTPMREGEVINLKWDRLSCNDQTIKLRSEDTKEIKSKEIPLTSEVYPIFCERHKRIKAQSNIEKERVFHPLTKNQFIYDLKKACNVLGYSYGRFTEKGLTAHSLRHTFITNADKLNIPQPVSMAIAGWSTSDMSQRYSHPDSNVLREAMEKINRLVNGQADPGQDSTTLMNEILLKLDKIERSVNQNVNKMPLEALNKEKEGSEYVS